MRAKTLVIRLFLLSGMLALTAACSGNGDHDASVRPALVVEVRPGGAGVASFAGEVRARHEPELSFRIGGKLAKRHAEVGDRVRAGQALAELDAADVALQLEAARAALASAEADLALANAELERHRRLYERQLVSQSLLETRQAQFDAAQARVRQARAQAAVSGNQAEYAVLRAPADGVITRRLAEAGQVVAAGQPVYVLAEDGEREVAISLPEQVAADFAPGRELLVELWSLPGKRFPGLLREVSPAADPQARTFAARVSFEPGDAPVELGQSARVYASGNGRQTLSVPLSALHRLDERPAVWVVDKASGAVSLRPVEIGAYGEEAVPVLAGLQAGDWVVAAGVHLLREGQRVMPVDRQNRPLMAPAVAAAAD
ncbi:efflux RND transporter periplasmic adaptor subunit [Arenimonas fontis]|uniref:Efflux RND transporter periplasmic adaptor subunit n=1 Tax=Arenimonas fontis TaxID=2608255 RepID=A0A5B2ZAN1_9GAMM|nr:efflux RND transporter periplasmic adaptor subunit [Arenimonas fontis]KAA2284370.1 efflux RND transporter periplasmic adaptor subunit [Arenimonas fontis]